jgi:hypothetical protein
MPSDSTLNFSALTDDQLVTLIRAACAEAVRRSPAVGAAARDAYLSEAEKAQIAADAAQREAERIRREEADRIAKEAAEKVRREQEQATTEAAHEKERKLWATRKGIALAFVPLLDAAGFSVDPKETEISITVWEKSDASRERRVYVNNGRRNAVACYYVSGNSRNAPETLTMADRDLKAISSELTALCAALAKAWKSLTIELGTALAWQGDAIPFAGYTPPAAETLRRTVKRAKLVRALEKCSTTGLPGSEAALRRAAAQKALDDFDAGRPMTPVAPARVELPASLDYLPNPPRFRCTDCDHWGHVGELIRHAGSCPTGLQAPADYVPPPAPAAPEVSP